MSSALPATVTATVAVIVGAGLGTVVPTVVHRFATPAGTVPVLTRSRSGPSVGWCTALGAFVFGLLTVALGADPALPAFLAVAAVAVPLAFIDLACLRLPDPLVGLAFLAALVGLVGAALLTGTPDRLLRALAGGACGFAAHLGLALLPGARLGAGDIKLAGVLGLLLGWLGWPTLLLGLVLPHLISGTVALAMLLRRAVRRQTPIPLGPALLGGALLATVLSAS